MMQHENNTVFPGFDQLVQMLVSDNSQRAIIGRDGSGFAYFRENRYNAAYGLASADAEMIRGRSSMYVWLDARTGRMRIATDGRG
jgi:hypothetical protein